MLNKKRNFIKEYWLSIIGIVLVITGFILAYIYCSSFIWCEFGNLLITIGLGLIAIGISLISVNLGKKALFLGKQSDQKMEEVEHLNFLRIKGDYEDRRLTLREKRLKIDAEIKENIRFYSSVVLNDSSKVKNKKEMYYLNRNLREFEIYFSFSIWKSLTYLNQIKMIKERLNKREQMSIINLTTNLFMELLEGRELIHFYNKRYKIDGDYPSHINQMYNIISDFKYFEKVKGTNLDEILKELRDILSNNITAKKRLQDVKNNYRKYLQNKKTKK